jgi:opacity protein-like surface antigen
MLRFNGLNSQGVAMNKLLLGTIVTIALAATAATAADMPVKAPRVAPAAPAYDWSGFYVGVGAGGTWSDVHRFYPQAIGGHLFDVQHQ